MISKRDSFSIEDVVSRIGTSHHTRPAHHVDWLGHLAALLVPDLLRLPALGLHCLEESKIEVSLLFGKEYLYVGYYAMMQKTFYRKQFHSEKMYTEKISFKCATHVERHFLGLVLTLLPEGVLAIVCDHFVLEGV